MLNDLVAKARGDDRRARRRAPALRGGRHAGARRALRRPASGRGQRRADPHRGAGRHGGRAAASASTGATRSSSARSESRVDSTVGATGAVYAIRRELFEPIPEDTILDDVLIPLRIVRRGYRVLFEPARARVRPGGDERRAGVRPQGADHRRQLPALPARALAADPRANRLWLATVSHKGLRLMPPSFTSPRSRRAPPSPTGASTASPSPARSPSARRRWAAISPGAAAAPRSSPFPTSSACSTGRQSRAFSATSAGVRARDGSGPEPEPCHFVAIPTLFSVADSV